MKNNPIYIAIAGASLLTLILSIILSVNFVEISPKNLAKVIKKDPYIFMEAVKVASQDYQKIAQKKALAGEDDRISNELRNPKAIDIAGRVTFGPKKAPVTIVEFSDFQCPYCAKASTRLKSLIKKYDGKVNVVYKNFPLSFHPFAAPAAHYFEAISLTNKAAARKFHDLIFDDFSKYARIRGDKEIKKVLNALAKKSGVTQAQVQKNIARGKRVVEKDLEEAKSLKVQGTPSFFVNGVNPGRKDLEEVIELILKNL